MTETARMYGGSLYDLAAEEGLEARILGELDETVALFKANPDYLHLLSTPSIPKRERCGLLDEALRDQVHLYVLNFLKILCEKGTAGAVRLCTGLPCALQSGTRHSGSNGDHCSGNDGAAGKEPARKAGKAHRQDHRPETKVDPAVLGGIRLDIEGTELDGTVQNRLAALRRDIASVTL